MGIHSEVRSENRYLFKMERESHITALEIDTILKRQATHPYQKRCPMEAMV